MPRLCAANSRDFLAAARRNDPWWFVIGAPQKNGPQGYGVVLIDPHGDLYHRLLAFCTWLSLRKPELQLHRRVVPFDVAGDQNIIGFNPIARNSRIMTYQVVALMEAIRKCWAQTSFDATPRLAQWLFNVAYALGARQRDAGYQAQDLVNPASASFGLRLLPALRILAFALNGNGLNK